MPQLNERGQRISPTDGHAYDTVYRHNQLPRPEDPGWGDHRHRVSGDVVRAINVHGPFDLIDEAGQEHHCPDGWLALDAEGKPFLVPAFVYADQYEVAE